MAKEVVIIYHNHLDPEWARCYERPLMKNGMLIRSYADVWDWIIDRWLSMADEGFGYTEGQYLVWRTYLNRHPEAAARIKQLIAEGKLELLLQGELTPETNYSPAEGLARNYLLAADFYKAFCSGDHPGTRIAWVWDAFGNSANMPQILKLAGAEAVGGTRYRQCPDDFWVGIDGTALPCLDRRQNFNDFRRDGGLSYYGLSRHAHCPHCGGYGCERCDGRGMVAAHLFQKEHVVALLEKAAAQDGEKAFVMIGGEETLPERCILDAVSELNARLGGITFRFGGVSECWNEWKRDYEAQRAQFVKPTVDLNPVHQGCYVTRIENKQRTREVCYQLIRAEAQLAAKAWQDGHTAKPAPEFERAWRNVLLNMHHDSISGAHIDAGQAEMMAYLDESEAIAAQYTDCSKPYTANRLCGAERALQGEREVKLGKMTVRYDLRGIVSIEKGGQDLFGRFRYENMTFTGNRSDEVRIGELMLQCEWGDNHNAYYLGDGVLLGRSNYSVYEGENAIWWRGRHETGDPCVRELSWEIRAQPSKDGERLNFFTEVNWDTESKRLRVLFPVNDRGSLESTWEIPYGFIKRSFDPDEQIPSSTEFSVLATRPIGEYPALHWVRHDIDAVRGVAILNKGIPSAKWIPGIFELSLLRSPQMTGDTVLPSIDEVWDVDGTRDTGVHRFEYSVWPYVDGLAMGDLTRAGYAYNRATPTVPFEVAGDVVVTAFKLAEDGRGYILRVQEAGGGDAELSLELNGWLVGPVDLMERPLEPVTSGEEYRRKLRRHEILTLKLQKEGGR